MGRRLQWHFPDGGSNVGFNHAGIQHFVGDASLFREVVQNSLDAKRKSQKQVVVELERTTIKRDDMDAATLLDVLRRCQKSKWLGKGKEQFARAVRILDGDGPVPALVITDVNTKGASDDAGSDLVSAWVGLTDSEGVPVGKGARSGGSYGLGKHAPFAATPLRTVLYSTCYKDSSTGQLGRRFIGRTILVTHYDSSGKQRSHSGYLGRQREPLKDGDGRIPELLRMDTRGTRLAIPGWVWSNESGEDWAAAAFRVIAEHYFYAVLKGRLGVTVEQEGPRGDVPTTLDATTLAPNGAVYRMLRTRNSNDTATARTVRYIGVASQEPVDTCHIPGIGHVALHVDAGAEHGSKKLALVRYPGVKITDIRGNMRPASPSFPHSWQPFTAVVSVEPGDEDADWVVRDCENPAHDRLDLERPDTAARRREAKQALEELGAWVRDRIGKVAGRSPDSTATESWELHDYDLTVTPPDGTDRSAGGSNQQQGRQMRLLPLREAASAETDPARGDGPPETQTRPDDSDDIEPVPDGPETPDEPGPGPRPVVPRPTPAATQRTRSVPLEPVFTPVFETYGSLSTHSVYLSIRCPDEPQELVIRVRPVGEDGWLPTLGLMDVSVPARVSPDHRNAFVLPADSVPGTNGRVAVELKFNEPIHDRSFSVTLLSTDRD